MIGYFAAVTSNFWRRIDTNFNDCHCSYFTGITYGFQVMDNGESPNIPFTIIRTRFPKAPSVVVYDNACNLQKYCLLRDPGFFKCTKFFVDKMHWWNHTGITNIVGTHWNDLKWSGSLPEQYEKIQYICSCGMKSLFWKYQ